MVQCSTNLEPLSVTAIWVKVNEHFVDHAVKLPPVERGLQIGEGVLACLAHFFVPHLCNHPA